MIKFVGYVEYVPTHWRAEFEVHGHPTLPEGSKVGWDVLKSLRTPPEPFSFPGYFEWRRSQFKRRLKVSDFLNKEIL